MLFPSILNSSLSIISINYNNSSGLEKTIVSVINQTYKNNEYIIVDGLSDDDSIDIIKKYESGITHSVIEADTGIYHAMNKGIRFAKGDYIIFLNSGERVHETLNPVRNKINRYSKISFIKIKRVKSIPVKNLSVITLAVLHPHGSRGG